MTDNLVVLTRDDNTGEFFVTWYNGEHGDVIDVADAVQKNVLHYKIDSVHNAATFEWCVTNLDDGSTDTMFFKPFTSKDYANG